jgi:hypothetical protein
MPDTARLRSLAPALWGAAVGALFGLQGLWAFVSPHVIDRDAGGRPGFDIPALSLLAATTVVALVLAWRAPADRVDA